MLSYSNCELINIKNWMKEWLELNKAFKTEKVNSTVSFRYEFGSYWFTLAP